MNPHHTIVIPFVIPRPRLQIIRSTVLILTLSLLVLWYAFIEAQGSSPFSWAALWLLFGGGAYSGLLYIAHRPRHRHLEIDRTEEIITVDGARLSFASANSFRLSTDLTIAFYRDTQLLREEQLAIAAQANPRFRERLAMALQSVGLRECAAEQ